ncbi:hypothetical protein G3O08_17880 [Cryomorpha ignava]|uniref:Uncharacterized protein n=1 Tax=Cryomorpha ignava TaxID=101383 RepID=A0A7K3WUL7_9FLAO|nr:hypothetical protein [Cryomorpha ignava]NEN25369.1 hypothetical protein [Cryomorpha ignava]
MSNLFENPFAVQSPEDIPAEDVRDLFVDVFTDFYHVRNPGHTFLHGPRGSGKSMMFRYMLPDCRALVLEKPLSQHDYFAVYIPIKATDLRLTEIGRLHKHADLLINEHLLVMHLAVRFFMALTEVDLEEPALEDVDSIRKYYEGQFRKRLVDCGWNEDLPSVTKESSWQEIFQIMMDVCESVLLSVKNYLKSLALTESVVQYSGAITGYLDFLFPLMKDIRKMNFMPKGPIFLMIDDADNLSELQTQILNNWVSYRKSNDVSLKISTQLNYKTWRTTTGPTIDTPHDYSEINIGTVYTTKKGKYKDRVKEIINKRLQKAHIEFSPEEFFPENIVQEDRIKEIAKQYKEDWTESGKGFRAGDDAYRYARPDYIKSLSGKSKSSSTYSYAGFEQLVHISSGIIRYFLQAASLMYGEMRAKSKHNLVTQISASVQDEVIKEYSFDFLSKEFDKLEIDEIREEDNVNLPLMLKNLINALGGAFRKILISGASERRIFSIAISGELSKEVIEILRLGVRYGYFQESSIGNKEGTGRTRQYILSRRLAPHYKLDPTGFSGYLFITNDMLALALKSPSIFIRKIEERLSKGSIDNVNEQLTLFQD